MNGLRLGGRLLRHAQQTSKYTGRRLLSTSGRNAAAFAVARPLVLGAITAAGVYGLYREVGGSDGLLQTVQAAAKAGGTPQPNVYSQTKDHAVYIWIHLNPDADFKACAKAAANLQQDVEAVSPAADSDEDDEIWAGVGFGPKFYSQVWGKAKKSFTYPHRKGAHGDLPSTGGDIFIHAKSNSVSKLYELTKRVIDQMPRAAVRDWSDTYSFVFRNGRDLSGFIDGTENRADEDERFEVAVNKETGGSYCITQRWIHKFDDIKKEKDATLSKFVGRSMDDSVELPVKPASSHVARMTGGHAFDHPKKFEIVRQSMPYGTVSGESGLFFIGFAAAPENFEFMLERMVGGGGGGDRVNDDIMRITRAVSGTYWYFPPAEQLRKLQ
ncbi:PREDICTED: probable deferrochelatase/peroxidase YfeX [Priapulus caudatus]|uniref:Probable deferrochelatase/peroxidase YfeX n=1 Tax=Priapulus caudatus TaxID=37621 RepID=A0ABM1E5L0_PRICU|nr:PREDICTED: probable deferrochelatase/peroxidase YfeX [Priapulus caudatus]